MRCRASGSTYSGSRCYPRSKYNTDEANRRRDFQVEDAWLGGGDDLVIKAGECFI